MAEPAWDLQEIQFAIGEWGQEWEDDDDDYDDDEIEYPLEHIVWDDGEDDLEDKSESESDNNSVDSPWEEVQRIPSVYANRHAFYSRIDEFWDTGKYTDVNIVCQDRIFKCHRLILAAASEYFDTMFYGGFRESRLEDIHLHGIDVPTFEEVLKYAYKGEVEIDEDNVFDLLCASEMFGLSFIEKCCVRYLRERTVPKDCALEIFMYASRTQKNTLLPAVSRCILEHLDRFSRKTEFLAFTFDEMNSWLLNCPFLSWKQENLMLDAISRWASRLNCSNEEKASSLTKLMQITCFRPSAADRVVEYLNKNVIVNDEGCDEDGLDVVDSKHESSPHIHAYINAFFPSDEFVDFHGEKRISNLFTVRKQNDVFKWDFCQALEPVIDDMRTLVHDDRIYCLKSVEQETTLSVCPTVDLSTDSQPLTLPSCTFPVYAGDVSLCSDKNSIYFFHCSDWIPAEREELFIYSRQLDTWAPCPTDHKKNVVNPSIACDDDRIYLIGGRWTRYLQAYDYRARIWDQLPKSKLTHSSGDKSCVHKGKIYVHCGAADKMNMLEVYDPVAGKWGALEIKSSSSRRIYPVRLLSYDDRLFVFNSEGHKSVLLQTYDSFLQEWSASSELHSATVNNVSTTFFRRVDKIVDVLVFES